MKGERVPDTLFLLFFKTLILLCNHLFYSRTSKCFINFVRHLIPYGKQIKDMYISLRFSKANTFFELFLQNLIIMASVNTEKEVLSAFHSREDTQGSLTALCAPGGRGCSSGLPHYSKRSGSNKHKMTAQCLWWWLSVIR